MCLFVAVSGLCWACGVLVPQAEIEPMSLALEGRFSTTGRFDFSEDRRRAESFLISASSQLPSVLNNPCAKVAYIEVAHLVPFNSRQVCIGGPQALGS